MVSRHFIRAFDLLTKYSSRCRLQGQLLHIVRRTCPLLEDLVLIAKPPKTWVAIDTRNVDKMTFFRVCAGLILSDVANSILVWARKRIETPLNARIRRWYSLHSFRARVRLDLPTYGEAAIRQKLSDASDNPWGKTVAWQPLELVTSILSATAQLLASVIVLLRILNGQRDVAVLVGLTLCTEIFYWFPQLSLFGRARGV